MCNAADPLVQNLQLTMLGHFIIFNLISFVCDNLKLTFCLYLGLPGTVFLRDRVSFVCKSVICKFRG